MYLGLGIQTDVTLVLIPCDVADTIYCPRHFYSVRLTQLIYVLTQLSNTSNDQKIKSHKGL